MEVRKEDMRKNAIINQVSILLIFMLLLFTPTGKGLANEKPSFGKDENGIQWVYNQDTKTLTFSGNKRMAANPEDDSHGLVTTGWNYLGEETEHIVIEDGILGIGKEVFSGFRYIKSVQIPDSVTQIDDGAFKDCHSLQEIELPSRLIKIGRDAFDSCFKLEKVTIPSTVTSIGESAFYGCKNLKSVTVPDSVKKIGVAAFAYCNELENVTLPKALKEISPQLFMFCKKLKVVQIPARVTKIGEFAFAGTGLKEIVIPSKVTKFYTKNKRTYESMSPLFKNCKKLKRITIKSRKIKSVYRYAFSYVTKKTTIRVPKSKLKTYKKMFRKAGLSKKVKVRAI